MKDFFSELSDELAHGALSPKKPAAPAAEQPAAPAAVPAASNVFAAPAAAAVAAGDNREIAREVGNEDGPKPHLAPTARKHFVEAARKPAAEDDMKPGFAKGEADEKRPGGKSGGRDRRRREPDFAPNEFPETKAQQLPPLAKGKTRVLPVGGQNAIGKNMVVFQHEDQFLITDCGVQFGEQHMLGVDYSIPDVTYLLPYKDKIQGILITHGHLDHIGSLKHVLPALGYPDVYGAKLTLALVKRQLDDVGIKNKARLIEVNPDSGGLQALGHFKFEFFRVNHSIPDACGIYVETPSAKIAHLGDYRFDFAPSIDKPSDFRRLAEIGARGIDLALGESTNSQKPGFTRSESIIGEEIARGVAQAAGRVIIATFASQVGRVQQVISAAEKVGRQVFLNGRSMVETVEICKEIGIVHAKQNVLHKVSPAIDKVADARILVLTTGSQGEENAGLYRMAMGEHPIVKIRPGDTVMMSSSPIPGNERSVVELINYLMKLGATVITNEGMDIHTSGHCYREEQKLMYSLIRPRYLLPVHGELYQRVANKANAVAVGVQAKNVFLLENGNMLEVAGGVVEKSKDKMFVEELVVDGNGIGTVSGPVIQAREQMMQGGVLVVSYAADKDGKNLKGEPHVESRGFLYPNEVKDMHRAIAKKAQESFDRQAKAGVPERDLVAGAKRDLEAFVLQKIGREPLVVPLVTKA